MLALINIFMLFENVNVAVSFCGSKSVVFYVCSVNFSFTAVV